MDEPRQHPLRRKEDQRPRRFRKGLYILPSLFTAANVLLGYYAILQVINGAVQYAIAHATRIQCARPGTSTMPPKPSASRFSLMASTAESRA